MGALRTRGSLGSTVREPGPLVHIERAPNAYYAPGRVPGWARDPEEGRGGGTGAGTKPTQPHSGLWEQAQGSLWAHPAP